MTSIPQLNAFFSSRYRIEREIGAGGMATVYLAEDVKHGRHVALKVLKPEIGAVLGVERFLAEIRVTATLQHPNLLPLFDSGDADGMLYYVMPFVEGETLRTRLERERQFSVDETVRIGSAIAAALDYAHAHGVIHRDLKPENILLQSGEPVVADFGIALAVTKAAGARLTQTGLSLGTPQYMSPEQATGDRAMDARTDIYSLGAVLYETLVGEPPHSGGTVQAIIARVVSERPRPVHAFRPNVPQHVAYAIEKALEKVPADRWSTAREFGDALKGRITAEEIARAAGRRADSGTIPPRWRAMAAAVALSIIAFASIAAVGWWRAIHRERESAAFTLGLTADVRLSTQWDFPLAISPDGRTIAYIGVAGPSATQRQLYIKRSEDVNGRPVPGTEHARYPMFSPDGKWIAFVVGKQIRRIPVAGGASIELPSGEVMTPGWPPPLPAWNSDDRLILPTTPQSGLLQVLYAMPALGGTPQPVTRLDSAAGEVEQRWPTAVGDDETILYTSYPPGNDMSKARIGVASLRTGRSKALDLYGLRALGVIDGRLIYVTKEGAIRAVGVDLGTPRVVGTAVTLVEGLKIGGGGPVAAALSRSGTLIYLAGRNDEQELVLVDESGARQAIRGRHDYDVVRASPDGRKIAAEIDLDTARVIWIYDRDAGTLSPLSHGRESFDPEWSRDGRWLYYRRYGGPAADTLLRQPSDGSGAPAPVAIVPQHVVWYAIHPVSGALVYSQFGASGTSGETMIRGGAADWTPRRMANFTGTEYALRFSPDGRWICFVATESGTPQVYVRSFPESGARLQVSTTHGEEPVWSPDGRRVFYRDGENFVAAEIDTRNEVPRVVKRSTLFADEYETWGDPAAYDVTRDGRFVLIRRMDERDQVVVIVNWADQVRARLGSRR